MAPPLWMGHFWFVRPAGRKPGMVQEYTPVLIQNRRLLFGLPSFWRQHADPFRHAIFARAHAQRGNARTIQGFGVVRVLPRRETQERQQP